MAKRSRSSAKVARKRGAERKKPASARKKTSAIPVSVIRKIERIEKRMEKAGKEDRALKGEHRKLTKLIEDVADEEKVTQNALVRMNRNVQKNIELIDKKQRFLGTQQEELKKAENKLLRTEQEIAKDIDMFGKYSVKRKYHLELTRGLAGAFLGTAIAYILVNMSLASVNMTLAQAGLLMVFVLGFSFIMLYRNQKLWVEEGAAAFAAKRLFLLYAISVVIGLIALLLTGGFTPAADVMFKSVALGSFPAMAGAVLFILVS